MESSGEKAPNSPFAKSSPDKAKSDALFPVWDTMLRLERQEYREAEMGMFDSQNFDHRWVDYSLCWGGKFWKIPTQESKKSEGGKKKKKSCT